MTFLPDPDGFEFSTTAITSAALAPLPPSRGMCAKVALKLMGRRELFLKEIAQRHIHETLLDESFVVGVHGYHTPRQDDLQLHDYGPRPALKQ